MPNHPLVSVIIPTYNRALYIPHALDSVLAQTYKDLEIIIVDDGSTDDTRQVVRPYLSDSRIQYVYQQNQKVSRARNNGIKHSRGRYIALLDSDDVWIDEKKLEKQIGFLESHPGYELVSGGIIRVDEKGNEISRVLNPETDQEIRASMLFSCLIAPSAAVFSRRAYDQVGGFNESSDVSEDWQLFLDIGTTAKMYNFQEYFLRYLQSSQNRSNFNRRENLWHNLFLVRSYQSSYPHDGKAFLIHAAYYLYSFMPFGSRLISVFSAIKKLVFGRPAYRKFPPT
jgi:glycosyltransferase involved in cell wall biosynthesis